MRTVTKHYGWDWTEVDNPNQAAWSEVWAYADDGTLVSRTRTARNKATKRPTISTDPRAGAIMREELGLSERNRPMGGPHR